MDIPINATLRSLCIDAFCFPPPPFLLLFFHHPYRFLIRYMKPLINH